jgi:hypothetical protein
MITNFLSGFSPFLAAAIASGTECKNGRAIVAPPALINFLLEILIMTTSYTFERE